MATEREWLDRAYDDLVSKKNLGHALLHLTRFVRENRLHRSETTLLDIDESYRLMKDFMLRGFRDEKREELYDSLLPRLYRVAANAELEYRIAYDDTIKRLQTYCSRVSLNSADVQAGLESYVQDMAMLSLSSESMHNDAERTLHASHQHYLSELFAGIVLSQQWSRADADFWSALLVSPTIDLNDALMLVSAITLACTTIYDLNKFLTLLNVYSSATDVHLRERAFVGWIFSMNTDFNELFPEQHAALEPLFSNANLRREILALQKQMFFCIDADKDNAKLQREILPTLMKNNPSLSRFGIVDKDEDGMQDILHPDAADQAMEEMERSFQKMQDMQQSGSDIYFGGFSQMKRFPFFSDMSNWFMPFTESHPALARVHEKLKSSRFLHILFKQGPFCDSDKYSFALAMSSIVDRIPENMREILNSGELMGSPVNQSEQQAAAYVRRMYLQDLYRFFRLNDGRAAFFNCFDFSVRHFAQSGFFFAWGRLPHALFEAEINDLCAFLLKQKLFNALQELLGQYPNLDSLNILRFRAACAMHFAHYFQAESLYETILEQVPDDEAAMTKLAKAYFRNENYELAEELYDKLLSIHAQNKGFLLARSIAQINQGRLQLGVETLYQLNYEYPDDDNVARALAWGLMAEGKLVAAEKLYDRFIQSSFVLLTDYLNAGYCKWFLSKNIDAVELFRQYMGQQTFHNSLADTFIADAQLLQANGITRVDEWIMCDLVAGD